MNKKTEEILDSLLPRMSSVEQQSMLRQISREADQESRKEAISDPISRIAMA